MITNTNFVDILVNYRCFKYYMKHTDQIWVYESLPEEGEGVKKLLGKFDDEDDADEFLEQYKTELKAHIESLIVVIGNPKVEDRLEQPISKNLRRKPPAKRKLKPKVPECDSSQLTLKPPASTQTSIQLSNSEQSPPT